MLRNRKQILTKIEVSDNAPATPTASDAVLIYEPQDTNDEVNFLARRPAGASLSRDFEPPGLTIRPNQFTQDFRGSGAVGTAPDWGRHLRACAMRETELVQIDLDSVSAAEQFVVGEIVYQGGSLAVASAIGICVTHLRGAAGTILVATISGTWDTESGLVGHSCGATSTVATLTTTGVGYGYLPDSLRLIQVTVASWSPSAPAISTIGAVLDVETSGGFVKGGVQVVSAGGGGTWGTTIQVALLWGAIANTDVLTNGTLSGTINADPVQIRTPSLTIWDNVDGYLEKATGCRGNFRLAGEAGAPLMFEFEFRGSANSHQAALPVATNFLGGVRAPRLFGAWVGMRVGDQFFRMPVKRLELTPANVLGPRTDANAAGGSQGIAITDRDPDLIVEVEQAGMAFDAKTMRDTEVEIGLGAVLGGNGTGTYAGRTAGNTCVVAAPKCQLKDLSKGDSEGVATWQMTLKPKRILEAGDDEFVLAMF